jgi:hypothetical protein
MFLRAIASPLGSNPTPPTKLKTMMEALGSGDGKLILPSAFSFLFTRISRVIRSNN